MKLQRCQFENATTGQDFRPDPSGVCGKGVYAMFFGDKKLRKYYSERGEKTFSFDVPDHLVKKVGGRGYTHFSSIRDRIEELHAQGYRVFICKHGGINVPVSKQVLITDQSIITNVQEI